jgi:hypothetical protein
VGEEKACGHLIQGDATTPTAVYSDSGLNEAFQDRLPSHR